jgi:hypothetical protein
MSDSSAVPPPDDCNATKVVADSSTIGASAMVTAECRRTTGVHAVSGLRQQSCGGAASAGLLLTVASG